MDLDLLIYAHTAADPQHTAAKDWWESSINASEPIGLPGNVMGGFIRLMPIPEYWKIPCQFLMQRLVFEAGWISRRSRSCFQDMTTVWILNLLILTFVNNEGGS